MSNWSVVIIAWSGVDDEVANDDHYGRFLAIAHRYAETQYREPDDEGLRWIRVHPCPDPQALGGACEFVAITHENYFSPETLLDVLKEFRWEYPEEVEVIWKNENMDRYECRQLEPTDNP